MHRIYIVIKVTRATLMMMSPWHNYITQTKRDADYGFAKAE